MFAYHRGASVVFTAVLLLSEPFIAAQQAGRTKVAEGEYKVTMEGDLGCGPIETEIFHFRESWTLWRTAAGYGREGRMTYQSPRHKIHDDRSFAKLAPDLRLLSTEEFARLVFRRDSGPLTCEFLPQQLHCDSGAKDPANGVDVQYAMDHPYSLIWPLSAFSLAGLTRAAPSQLNKPAPIQVVQLQEIDDVLPILAICSDGLIRYIGQGQNSFGVSGQTWHPNVYELTASPVRKMTIGRPRRVCFCGRKGRTGRQQNGTGQIHKVRGFLKGFRQGLRAPWNHFGEVYVCSTFSARDVAANGTMIASERYYEVKGSRSSLSSADCA